MTSLRLLFAAAFLLASGAAGAQSLAPEAAPAVPLAPSGVALGATVNASPTMGWTVALRHASPQRAFDVHVGVRGTPEVTFGRQLTGRIVTIDASAQLPLYSMGPESFRVGTAFGAMLATDTYELETEAGAGLLASASVSTAGRAEAFADAGFGVSFLRSPQRDHRRLRGDTLLFTRLRFGLRIYP